MSQDDARVVGFMDAGGNLIRPRVRAQSTVWEGQYTILLVPLSLLAEAERERDAFKRHCDLLTHKVITCGVAASHSDATLTTRGAYAKKWDSPQAQDVRKLRAERDALQSRLDAVGALADKWEEFDRRKGSPAVHSAAQQLRSAALGGESPANDEERK